MNDAKVDDAASPGRNGDKRGGEPKLNSEAGEERPQRPSRHQRPYPGLRPFIASERRFFFGRDEQIADIIERLEKSHFAAIVGGSGSGKSSILRAGVIPELRVKRISGRGDFWLIVDFTPEDEPFHKLARALDRVLVRIGPEETERRICDIEDTLLETGSIAGFLRRFRDQLYLEEGQAPESRQYANLLVFCDQFEEIFRDENRNSVQASQLVDLFVEAFDNRKSYDSLFLVIGMRSEDLHRCSAYMGLPHVINESSYLTRRLNEKEIEESILEPARELLFSRNVIPSDLPENERDPWPFEGSLLRRIYDEIDHLAHDPDHLPLLQHLLCFLWRNCGPRLLWLRRATFSVKDPKARIGEADAARALGFASVKALDDSLAATGEGLFARCLNHAANKALARSTVPPGPASGRSMEAGQLRDLQTDRRLRSRATSSLTGTDMQQPESGFDSGSDPEAGEDSSETGSNRERRAAAAKRRVVEFMFRLLAEVDDRGNYKRRWTTRAEISAVCGGSEETIDGIVAAFTKPYPFLHIRSGRNGNIDVSHESFIRNWSQFRSWLENERELANCFEAARKEYKRARKRRDATSGFFTRMWSRCFDRLDKDRLRELSPWWSARGRNDAWADRYAEGIAAAKTETEIEEAKKASREILPGLRRFYQGSIWASWFRRGFIAFICGVALLSLLVIVANQAKLTRTQLQADYLTPFAIAVGLQQEIRGSPVGPQSEARLVEALYALKTAEGIAKEQRELSSGLPLSLRGVVSRILPSPNAGVTEIVRQVNDSAVRLAFASLLWKINKPLANAAPSPPASAPCGNDDLQEVSWENNAEAPPGTSYRVLRETLAPLEQPNGRRLAALGSEGLIHFALLPPGGQPCSLKGARYIGGVSTPPNSTVEIDPQMRLIVANEKTKTGNRAWVYRVRWLRNCRGGVKDGLCERTEFAPFAPSAIVVSDENLRPIDRTTLAGGGGSIWSLRWDDQPDLLVGTDAALSKAASNAFAQKEIATGDRPAATREILPSGDVKPNTTEPRCVSQGRYGAVLALREGHSPLLEYTIAVAESQKDGDDPCRPALADEDIIMKMRFVGPPLDDLAFGAAANGRPGRLFLRGAEKALVYSLAWHPDQLRDILCSEIKTINGGVFSGYAPPSTPGRPRFSDPFDRLAEPEGSIIQRTEPCD